MTRTAVLLAALAVSSLMLSGCTAGGTDPAVGAAASNPVTGADVADPNHAAQATRGSYPLTSTPDLRRTPGWLRGSLRLPAGWTVAEQTARPGDADRAGPAVPATAPRTAIVGSLRNSSCQLTAGSGYLDSFNHGKGDLFLSKQSLYSGLEDAGTLAARESSALLATTRAGHPLQFETARFAAPKTAPAEEDGEKPAAVAAQHGLIAVRVIDAAVPNPYTAAEPGSTRRGRFGSDARYGLPVLTVRYACAGSDEVSDDVWAAALKSLRVQLP